MIARLPSLLVAAAAVAALAAEAPLHAQTAAAALVGSVRTTEGHPVADAVVQARAHATGSVRSAVSSADGSYRMDELPPGSWTVVALMADGRLSDSSTVEVRLQQTVTLDFTVGGGPSERVLVRAEPPLVDRRQVGGELRMGGAQVDALPLAGRDFTGLALLDSSARQAAPGNYAGERGSVFVVNGQSGRSNSFLIDGLDNNDQTSGTTLNGFFSQQVIDEFVLMTHQFAPEFGRASGGVLNVVTKRGTNEPLLEAFLQGATRSMSEPSDFVTSLAGPDDARDTPARFATGLSAGGALVPDRAFYFAAYEHQSDSAIAPYTGIDRNGFAQLGNKGYEGGPAPEVGGGVVVAPATSDTMFARFDFNLSDRDTLMVRLSGDDRESEEVNVGDIRTPESGFALAETDVQLAAAWTRVLASGKINELRLLLGRSALDQRASSERVGVSRPSGIWGGNVLARQDRDEDRFQIVHNLTWRKDAHLFKFGADVLSSRTRIEARFNPNGSLIYDYDLPYEPGDCGDLGFFQVQTARDSGTYPIAPCAGIPGADDDLDGREGPGSAAYDCADGVDNDGDGATDSNDPGCVAGVDEPGNILSYPVVFTRVNGEPDSVMNDLRVGLFAQDRWEVGRRWVLDYGLRYDLSTYELPGSIAVASSIPNGGATRDTDNLAPRFGFTFAPDPRGGLVVRGGAGVFYDKLVLAFPAVSAVTSGTSIEFSFPQGLTCEVSEGTIEGTEPSPCELDTIFFDPLTLKFSTGTELDTPYTVQYTLGIEQRLGPRSALRLDGIHALGYHLPLFKDLNPVICVPDDDEFNPDCPFVPLHPDETTGSIAAIVTEGRSWYSGLDAAYRWQAAESWFSASYTLSKAEDMGFDPLKNLISLPPDSTDLSSERGRTDGSRRHRLVVSGDFPLGWMGLRASGTGQFSTGIPFNVTTGQDDNLDGILTDRPPGVGRNEGEDSALGAINAVREEVNALLGLGLEPVGSLQEPSFSQIDLRVYKRFASASTRGHGEMYLQVFNLLDRENPGLIEGRATAQGFGETVTLAGPPRTLELGLRLGY